VCLPGCGACLSRILGAELCCHVNHHVARSSRRDPPRAQTNHELHPRYDAQSIENRCLLRSKAVLMPSFTIELALRRVEDGLVLSSP
jgi:hypothetical protein